MRKAIGGKGLTRVIDEGVRSMSPRAAANPVPLAAAEPVHQAAAKTSQGGPEEHPQEGVKPPGEPC